jgi:hypothetical protein
MATINKMFVLAWFRIRVFFDMACEMQNLNFGMLARGFEF